MSPQSSPTKANKGTVQIKNSNGRLQLVFSYGSKRHYISLGFTDSKSSRKLAELRAREIELDILSGNFDATLAKYKPEKVPSPSTAVTPITPTPVQPSLAELWEKYTDYKRPQVSQSTIAKDFVKTASHINKLPTDDLSEAIAIRNHLVQQLTPNAAKRCLTQFAACCNWAVKSELIAENPFKGMASEIKQPKAQTAEADIDPFTAQERDAILAAFAANRYYSPYAPLVKFLFSTGCRPSEAIALQWQHISNDYQLIRFEQAVTVSTKGLAMKQGLKTQEKRRFPCNASLRAFLKAIKPEQAQPHDLVFPSPEGKYIDFHNFRNRAWQSVLSELKIRYRKPYQMKHTFITLALENGLEAKDVARLVGNSPEMIYRHYAGGKRNLFVPEF
jgi:integrase